MLGHHSSGLRAETILRDSSDYNLASSQRQLANTGTPRVAIPTFPTIWSCRVAAISSEVTVQSLGHAPRFRLETRSHIVRRCCCHGMFGLYFLSRLPGNDYYNCFEEISGTVLVVVLLGEDGVCLCLSLYARLNITITT